MVEPEGLEVAADWRTLGSPETYLGYGQSSGFWSEDRATFDQAHAYGAEARSCLSTTGTSRALGRSPVTLRSSNEPGGRIAFQFHARDVNLVMGPLEAGAAIPFQVFLDGEVVDDALGTDVDADGRGTVRDQNTYQLIRQSGPVGDRRFEIEFLEAGVEGYCFTFG